jgi:HAD superfamily phosphatase (TIGR01668 family)
MGSYSYNSALTGTANAYYPNFSIPSTSTNSTTATSASFPTTTTPDSFTRNVSSTTKVDSTSSNKPDLKMTQFSQLNMQNLQANGCGNVKGVVFDVDDTLSKYKLTGQRTIPPELKAQLKELQANGIQLGIVSNNPNDKLVQQFKKELAADGIEMASVSNAQKPGTKGLREMQKQMGDIPDDQMLMIGDNPETDVASGKNAGFKTAQVDWFGNGALHKDMMKWGDEGLGGYQKMKQTLFGSKSSEPVYSPAIPISSPIAATA